MFERLLLSDIVVADLSIPNPNVYYELGIRHAARPRSTITLGCFTGSAVPFDVAPLRHLTYTSEAGVPEDIAALRDILQARICAGLEERSAADSPLFALVAGYPAIELSRDFAESYRDRVGSVITWRSLLQQAVASGDVNEVDQLVDSCGGNVELIVDAVLAYRDLQQYGSMIDLLEKHRAIASSAPGTELLAFAYNRRNLPGDRAKAVMLLEALIERDAMTSERGALLGRVFKDSWLAARAAGTADAAILREQAIDAYRKGFEADPRDPYPGVNLTTLLALAGEENELAKVSPVVAFALARRGGLRARDYYDLAALCELCCAIGDMDTARQAAALALTRPHPTWARASTARNLALLGEVRPLAAELSLMFA
jgi:tetratricopeptide (TPR) repeat protein